MIPRKNNVIKKLKTYGIGFRTRWQEEADRMARKLLAKAEKNDFKKSIKAGKEETQAT